MFGESLLFTFLVIGARAQNYFEWSNHDGIQVSLNFEGRVGEIIGSNSLSPGGPSIICKMGFHRRTFSFRTSRRSSYFYTAANFIFSLRLRPRSLTPIIKKIRDYEKTFVTLTYFRLVRNIYFFQQKEETPHRQ